MTRYRTSKVLPTFAWLLAATLLASLATAQSRSSAAGQGFGFAYDQTKEISFVGPVAQVVSQPAPGSPPGLHLLISTGDKTVDAHLGPYVPSEVQQALKAGQLVQVVGVNQNIHGSDVLLARQLVFSGREVTIRNERGFLVRDPMHHRKPRDNKSTVTGGAQ